MKSWFNTKADNFVQQVLVVLTHSEIVHPACDWHEINGNEHERQPPIFLCLVVGIITVSALLCYQVQAPPSYKG